MSIRRRARLSCGRRSPYPHHPEEAMPRFAARVALFVAILFFSYERAPLVAQPAAKPSLAPIFEGLSARCIGPANMGGRIADLAVVESDPVTFYVATAGGGVWKTPDGGTTL